MGFMRNQEKRIAVRLLEWRYEKLYGRIPPGSQLKIQADQIVDEAHKIARVRGSNVLSIVKDMVAGIPKNKI